ncbi:hypothetical protein AgCh_010691 [Apium graveolens]
MYWFKRSRDNISSVKFPVLYIEDVVEEKYLLDLPDLALDCILKKLSAPNLSRMSRASTTLRGMCTSDHLWERHMKRKWGGLIGNLAYNEWKWSIDSRKHHLAVECCKNNGFLAFFWSKWDSRGELSSTLPVDSVMALYLSLETGKFWFPAQVFNREVSPGAPYEIRPELLADIWH